jgi:hypothetical protein
MKMFEARHSQDAVIDRYCPVFPKRASIGNQRTCNDY